MESEVALFLAAALGKVGQDDKVGRGLIKNDGRWEVSQSLAEFRRRGP